LKPNDCTRMDMRGISLVPMRSIIRLRSWCTLVWVVSMTRSASSAMLASSVRSRWMASTRGRPRRVSGCLRAVQHGRKALQFVESTAGVDADRRLVEQGHASHQDLIDEGFQKPEMEVVDTVVALVFQGIECHGFPRA